VCVCETDQVQHSNNVVQNTQSLSPTYTGRIHCVMFQHNEMLFTLSLQQTGPDHTNVFEFVQMNIKAGASK
jgi:hypothetical protein